MAAEPIVLVLNRGSSSLKFALYKFATAAGALLASGEVERLGKPDGHLRLQIPGQAGFDASCPVARGDTVMAAILDELERHGCPQPATVGHRLVNGGPDYSDPQKITPQVLARLREIVPLAPLHLSGELELVSAVAARWPQKPQVACFDTAFHRDMPEVAQRLPVPRALWDEGVRRYGFHGLSCEYVMQKLAPASRTWRAIIAHLGSGSSLTAVASGRSVETTMGFTPSGGVMMGTRTGDLDPGVLLYLLREKHLDGARLEELVDHESGLLGVSGITADMKALLDRRAGEPHAREAVDLYCYLIRKQVGALAAVLGGLDALVFTGGIGEHAAAIRSGICQGLEHLGIRLDPRENEAHEEVISVTEGGCAVRVVVTNEELMIARHTHQAIFEMA